MVRNTFSLVRPQGRQWRTKHHKRHRHRGQPPAPAKKLPALAPDTVVETKRYNTMATWISMRKKNHLKMLTIREKIT
jgi:hypothetical protein